MRRKLIRQLVAAAAVGLTLVSLAPPAAQAAAPGGAVQWAPCAQDATALCATLDVPVDWADPDGPTIGLALAKRPATDPQRGAVRWWSTRAGRVVRASTRPCGTPTARTFVATSTSSDSTRAAWPAAHR